MGTIRLPIKANRPPTCHYGRPPDTKQRPYISTNYSDYVICPLLLSMLESAARRCLNCGRHWAPCVPPRGVCSLKYGGLLRVGLVGEGREGNAGTCDERCTKSPYWGAYSPRHGKQTSHDGGGSNDDSYTYYHRHSERHTGLGLLS